MSFFLKQQNTINLSHKQQKYQLEQKYVMDFFISETNQLLLNISLQGIHVERVVTSKY